MYRILRVTGLVATGLMMAACAGEPSIQTGEDAETIMGTLNRVDNSRVALAYVDPSVDYSRYARIFVLPLGLDNVEIVQPSSGSTSAVNRHNADWELTDQNREQLQAAFQEVMERELTMDGAFTMAEGGGDDVLAIEAMLTRIAPTAPQDNAASRGAGRNRVYTNTAGSVSIAIAFADGDSGEVLAIIKDTRGGNTGTWGVNNSVTNMSEVRRAFASWASRTREGLLRLQETTADQP